MKTLSILLLAMCSAVLSQQSFANHHEAGESTKKCEGMANGNFSISGLDANQDGNISKEEYLTGDKSNSEKTFKHIDANSDGQLSALEQKDIEAVYKEIHLKHKAKNTNI